MTMRMDKKNMDKKGKINKMTNGASLDTSSSTVIRKGKIMYGERQRIRSEKSKR